MKKLKILILTICIILNIMPCNITFADDASEEITPVSVEQLFSAKDNSDMSVRVTSEKDGENTVIYQGRLGDYDSGKWSYADFDTLNVLIIWNLSSEETICIQPYSSTASAFSLTQNDCDTWNGTSDTSWYNATDTSFTLNTAEQLAGLAVLVNGGTNFIDKTITLGTNLDLANLEWTPIGNSSSYKFKGTFDGDGHTISGLYFNNTSKNYFGLFGFAMATIKNLSIKDSSITGKMYIGAICGYNSSGSISNCCSTAIVNGSKYTGGICGYTANLSYCYTAFEGTGSTVNYNGAIAGRIQDSANCYFDSTLYSGTAIGIQAASNTSACAKTTEQFASGEVAYLLQSSQTEEIWGQDIGSDTYPTLGGSKVFLENSTYCNYIISGYNSDTKSAVLKIGSDGEYTVIFADYDTNGVLSNIDSVSDTLEKGENTITLENISMSLGSGDKIFLWNSFGSMKSLCGAYIVE